MSPSVTGFTPPSSWKICSLSSLIRLLSVFNLISRHFVLIFTIRQSIPFILSPRSIATRDKLAISFALLSFPFPLCTTCSIALRLLPSPCRRQSFECIGSLHTFTQNTWAHLVQYTTFTCKPFHQWHTDNIVFIQKLQDGRRVEDTPLFVPNKLMLFVNAVRENRVM